MPISAHSIRVSTLAVPVDNGLTTRWGNLVPLSNTNGLILFILVNDWH